MFDFYFRLLKLYCLQALFYRLFRHPFGSSYSGRDHSAIALRYLQLRRTLHYVRSNRSMYV